MSHTEQYSRRIFFFFNSLKGTELSPRRLPTTKTVVFFLSRAHLNRIIKCNHALQLPILHPGSFKVPLFVCFGWKAPPFVFMKNGLRFFGTGILPAESMPILENASAYLQILHFLLPEILAPIKWLRFYASGCFSIRKTPAARFAKYPKKKDFKLGAKRYLKTSRAKPQGGP